MSASSSAVDARCSCNASAIGSVTIEELFEIEDRRSHLRLCARVERVCFACGFVVDPAHLRGYLVDGADLRRLSDIRTAMANLGDPLSRTNTRTPAWAEMSAITSVPFVKAKHRRSPVLPRTPQALRYVQRALGMLDEEDSVAIPSRIANGRLYADRTTIRHIAYNDHAHLEMIMFARHLIFSPLEVWRVPAKGEQPEKLIFLWLVNAGDRLLTDLVSVDNGTGRMITGYRMDADPANPLHVEKTRSLPNSLIYASWASKLAAHATEEGVDV